MPGNSEERREAIYFQPGQILFLVTGEPDTASETDLLEWANKVGEGLRLGVRKPRSQRFRSTPAQLENAEAKLASKAAGPERQYISPSIVERGSFSLVHMDVIRLENENKLGGGEEDPELLLDFILQLDERRKETMGEAIQVVSPNWLASTSRPEPGGTGGPGGLPTPYDGSPDTTEYRFHFDPPKSPPPAFLHLDRGTGKDVVVAILDTAPRLPLNAIYEQWAPQGHALISTLLDPKNPRLMVHTGDPRKLLDPFLSRCKCIDHEYRMNDHGIFVAGIIHSLAPEAELHLFQVLNEYGVGTLEIIGGALESVVTEFGKNTLVVNLSLTLDIPLEKGHTKAWKKDVDDVLGEKILRNKSWLERVAQLTEWISDLIYSLGSRVIAAAGNDYKEVEHGPQRPQARYPAAFERVVGVGALPRFKRHPSAAVPLRTASYSNLADRPKEKGITTLGGEEGAKEGVLGIYVEEFPNGSPSRNGWAWWCGTSFATPIMTGATAAVLSSMLSDDPRSTVEGAIQELYEAEAILTTGNEDVLFVTQGAPATTP
jgi:hypothetical protein